MKRTLSIVALGISVFAIPSAFGADGYVTGSVNLRAGPDSSYPSVAMLPAGAAVAIEGCVDGWSWCDVAAGNDRGWVAGDFLQEEYQGQRVLVPAYGVQIGIPVVSFVFGTYWDNYYRNRSWYGNREHWSHITPQYRSVTVHGDQHSNVHEDVNTHSHGTTADVSHAAHATVHRTGDEAKQTAVATTRPAYQAKPSKPVVSQHAVATQVSPVNHAKPVEPHAVESRAVTPQTAAVHKAAQPTVVAQHKAVDPKAVHKQAPEKDAQEKKDNNDKDGH